MKTKTFISLPVKENIIDIPNLAEQARDEFNNLRSDDDHFDAQWSYNDHEAQEKSFYEWCSLYDDLKHIKKTKEVN
jgi:hypothetical protein